MDKKHGCAMLAGGAGSRMGRINKADLEYMGQSFADRIADEFMKTGMPCYLSSANYEQCLPDGWKLVRDVVRSEDGSYIGPMGGIYSCLLQARLDGLDGLFFAPCDAPLFSAELISRLRLNIGRDCDAVCFRTTDGKVQTTYGWYSIDCLDAFEEDIKSGKYKLLKTLRKLRFRTVDAVNAGIDESNFTNINSIDDYSEVCRGRHPVERSGQ